MSLATIKNKALTAITSVSLAGATLPEKSKAGFYADGTSLEAPLALGAQFQGAALAFRILVPGVGTGQRNTSASYLNPYCAITAAHNIWDLRQYNPTYEVASGTNFKTDRGIVMPVSKVIIHPEYDGTNFSPDLAILVFAAPFYASEPKVIGSASDGDITCSAGFGRWGTPSTAWPPQDGGLRAWQARVLDYPRSGLSIMSQSTAFGYNTEGLTLNGRGASGDSGGPVFNLKKELVGISVSASTETTSTGFTTYLRLDRFKPWLEEQTALIMPKVDPELLIERSASGIKVSWDAKASGWRLQRSRDLSEWINQGDTITTSGSFQYSGNESAQFFRLIKP